MVTSRSPPPHSLNMDHSLAFSVNQNPAVTMETVTSCSLSPWWWNMEILGHALFVKNTTENKQTGCLQIIVTFYWTTHTHTHLYGCTDSVSGGRGFSERRRSYVEHCTNNELADMRRMSWCCSVRINMMCLNLICLFVDTMWEHRASSVDRMSFIEMSKYLSFASLNIHLVWRCDVEVSLQLQSDDHTN